VRIVRKLLTTSVIFFLAATFGLPQEFRATITGRVTDASGSAVTGAKVEAKGIATGTLQSTVTSDDGAYQIPFLNPGEYVLTVEKSGFRRAVREGLRLQVAERASIDFSLQLGEVSQSVTVQADAPVLETETADRGLSIESNRVKSGCRMSDFGCIRPTGSSSAADARLGAHT
jgi:hypothetical protein